MGVEFGLALDRLDDFGRRVADVQNGDARREVDQAVAVDVLDDRARARAVTIGWMSPTPLRRRLPTREPLPGLRAGDLGDELAFLWDVHRFSVSGASRNQKDRVFPGDASLNRVSADVRGRAGPNDGGFCTFRLPRGPMGRSGHPLYAPYNAAHDPFRSGPPGPTWPAADAGGGQEGDRPQRPVGPCSELDDPTPWLKGGEVLLTTGMGVGSSPARAAGLRPATRRRGDRRPRIVGGPYLPQGPQGDAGHRRAAGLPAGRDPLPGAVHRDHRSDRLPPARRTVQPAPTGG